MTVFGLMISMTTAAIETAEMRGTVGAGNHVWLFHERVAVLFTFSYVMQRYSMRVSAIRYALRRGVPYKPQKVFIGLCASAPNFILALLVVITGFFGRESSSFAFAWAGGASGVLKLIALLFQGMYWGIMLQLSRVEVIAAIPPYWYVLITLPLLATGFLGYFAGLKDRSLKNAIKKAFTPVQSTKSTKEKRQ